MFNPKRLKNCHIVDAMYSACQRVLGKDGNIPTTNPATELLQATWIKWQADGSLGKQNGEHVGATGVWTGLAREKPGRLVDALFTRTLPKRSPVCAAYILSQEYTVAKLKEEVKARFPDNTKAWERYFTAYANLAKVILKETSMKDVESNVTTFDMSKYEDDAEVKSAKAKNVSKARKSPPSEATIEKAAAVRARKV